MEKKMRVGKGTSKPGEFGGREKKFGKPKKRVKGKNAH